MNNTMTLFKDEANNLSNDIDFDQLTFPQHNLYSTEENIPQKIYKLQIFNPLDQSTAVCLIKLDGTIKYDAPPKIIHKTITKEKQQLSDIFLCPICQKQFSSHQAVGGHCSRTHPNESKKYLSKVAKREERKYELERTRQLQSIVQNDLEF